MAKVGIIGHFDHGKRALTAAIIAVHKNFPTAEELTMTTETNTPGAGLPDPDRAAVVRALVRAYCYTQEFAERYFDSHFVARELPAASLGEHGHAAASDELATKEVLVPCDCGCGRQCCAMCGNDLGYITNISAPTPSTTGSGDAAEHIALLQSWLADFDEAAPNFSAERAAFTAAIDALAAKAEGDGGPIRVCPCGEYWPCATHPEDSK